MCPGELWRLKWSLETSTVTAILAFPAKIPTHGHVLLWAVGGMCIDGASCFLGHTYAFAVLLAVVTGPLVFDGGSGSGSSSLLGISPRAATSALLMAWLTPFCLKSTTWFIAAAIHQGFVVTESSIEGQKLFLGPSQHFCGMAFVI